MITYDGHKGLLHDIVLIINACSGDLRLIKMCGLSCALDSLVRS